MNELEWEGIEDLGWLLLAQRSMKKLWDNKEDEVWEKA